MCCLTIRSLLKHSILSVKVTLFSFRRKDTFINNNKIYETKQKFYFMLKIIQNTPLYETFVTYTNFTYALILLQK